MPPYTVGSEKSGRYASLLEQDWASTFRAYGIPGRYVGDKIYDHDFELWPDTPDELWVEVKPDDNKVWYLNGFVRSAAARLMARFEDNLYHTPDRTSRDAVILAGRRVWLYLSWTPQHRYIVQFDGPEIARESKLTPEGLAKVEEARKKDAGEPKKDRITHEMIAQMDSRLWVETTSCDLLTPIRQLRAGIYKHKLLLTKFNIDATYHWSP